MGFKIATPITDFGEAVTKQAFKEDCDINKILGKYKRTGTLTHLAKHEAQYADFSDFDYNEAQNRIAEGKQIFMDLPAETRKEFDQDPGKFFEFVNNPDNAGILDQKLPEIAKPGEYFPDVSPLTPPDATLEPVAPKLAAADNEEGAQAP